MQQGPVSADKLVDNGVNIHTKVWAEGMEDWTEAGNVAELHEYFAPKVTPPPYRPAVPPPTYASNQGNMPPKPDNNMVWAILSLVLCCLPLGIVSVIKAGEVDSKYSRGDYEGARRSAESAKSWAIWGAVLSAIAVALYVIFVVVAAAAAGSSAYY